MRERNGFRLDRLRLGEWLIGVAGLALAVDVLALPWYSLRSTFRATSAGFGQPTTATAFQAHHLIGPFAILCALLGLAVWGTQATQRAPALPVCLTMILLPLSLILVITLLVGVVLDPPVILVSGAPGVNTTRTDVAAVASLFLAVLLFAGAWRSLRTDEVAAADAPSRIETLALTQRSA